MWSYPSTGGRASRSGLLVALLVSGGLTAACGDAPADSVNGVGTGGDTANLAGTPSSSGAASQASSGAGGSTSPGGSGSSHAGIDSAGNPVGGAASGSGVAGANTSGGGAGSASGGVTTAGGSSGGGSGLPNPLGAPQVFIEKCAVCHGVDAKGTVTGPEVEHTPAPLVTYYVRNGDDNTWMGCDVDKSGARPCSSWGDQRVMTAFPANQVSDADITAITAWLGGLPKPTTGAALYADYCAGCHGPGGDIPTFTYYVKGPGPVQSADLAKLRTIVADGLTANRQIDERSRYMPPFKSLLSDAEVTLIARWMCTQTFSVTPPFCAQL